MRYNDNTYFATTITVYDSHPRTVTPIPFERWTNEFFLADSVDRYSKHAIEMFWYSFAYKQNGIEVRSEL